MEKLASGVRRVALVDAAGHVQNVVTQSTVLKFIHAHATAELGPLLKQTAHELNFTQGVLTVSEETPALEAFRQMAHSKLGSVAVVDENGSVVTNLSLSDIKNVAYEGTLACLYLPSISYVSALRQRSTRVRYSSVLVCVCCSDPRPVCAGDVPVDLCPRDHTARYYYWQAGRHARAPLVCSQRTAHPRGRGFAHRYLPRGAAVSASRV